MRVFILFGLITIACSSEHAHHVVWTGDAGLPGSGKHIVYLTNDHEYRTEETMAALGRIMAKHYGFTCTYIVGVNDSGIIQPGNGTISGLEVLQQADLLVLGIRWQFWPEAEMKYFDEYVNAGKPIIGLRTTTHGFRMDKAPADYPYMKYAWDYEGADYPFGFGEQVIGEHWVGHYGKNHSQASLLKIEEANADHVVLTGVQDLAHVTSGGYSSEVEDGVDGCTVLLRGHVLDGMTADSPLSPGKAEKMAVAWTRHYAPAPGAGPHPNGRVFGTLHGSSEDITDPHYRRLLINAHLWCLQLEDHITAENTIDFVGPYNPITFGRGAARQDIEPTDIAGFESPIFDPTKPVAQKKRKKKK